VAAVWLLHGRRCHIDVCRLRQSSNTFGFIHFQAVRNGFWFSAHANLIGFFSVQIPTPGCGNLVATLRSVEGANVGIDRDRIEHRQQI
jgi:hypothetical protein